MSALRFTSSDGSLATVTIQDTSGNTHRQINYVPQEPELTETEAVDALFDGGEVPVTTRRNVVETIEVYFSGGLSTVRSLKKSVERMLQQARNYQRNKVGPRIYIESKPDDSDSSYYRSEILNGKVSLHDATMGILIRSGQLILTITIKRRFYWEDTTEVYLPLTNQHGSSVSVGLTVYNSNDSSHDNYVSIAGANIDGDLPAPCRIEITNTYDPVVETRMGAYWLGHCASFAPSPANTIFQGESISGAFGSSVSSNAAYSNGQYRAWSWSGIQVVTLGYWTLSSAFLQAAGGGFFRAMLNVGTNDPQGSYTLKLRFMIEGLATVWETPEVRPPNPAADGYYGYFDMFTVQLPPYLIEAASSTMYPLDMYLIARSDQSGAHGFYLDFLQLLPLESYRVLKHKGFGVATFARLVDDEMLGLVYTDGWSTSGKLGNFVGYGTDIYLVPGITNYLYFGAATWQSSAVAEISSSVRVAYRPRRLSI